MMKHSVRIIIQNALHPSPRHIVGQRYLILGSMEWPGEGVRLKSEGECLQFPS